MPLGEESERYQVEILDAAGKTARRVEVSAPGWTYGAALAAADLPGASALTVRVAQIGTGGRLGLAATRSFPLA